MKRLYSYKCNECSTVTEALREMDERGQCPPCSHCGEPTFKIISPGIRATVKGVDKGNYNSGDFS